MSTSDPPPIPRDLAEDEPDLPTDAELDAMAPPLPPMDTNPMDHPMPPVAPGPEEARPPIGGAPRPATSLEDVAEAVEEGRLPESDL